MLSFNLYEQLGPTSELVQQAQKQLLEGKETKLKVSWHALLRFRQRIAPLEILDAERAILVSLLLRKGGLPRFPAHPIRLDTEHPYCFTAIIIGPNKRSLVPTVITLFEQKQHRRRR